MTLAADASTPILTESSPHYAGWRVVFACFLLALFLFGFALYGQSIYVAELQRLNGWQPGLISGASTLSLLLANILAIFTDELLARFGVRRLILTGIATLAASTSLLAFATTPERLYLAFVLMSLGWTGMGAVVIASLLNIWFERRRGLALTLAFTGASSGGVVVAPMLVVLVEQIGFRAAMLSGTAVMVAILLPAVLLWIRPRPFAGAAADSAAGEPQMASDMSRAEILRCPSFWTISVPFALGFIAQLGLIVHQIALLESKVGRAGAGVALALMTSMALAGRLCLSLVVDRFDPRRITAVSLLSQAFGVFLVLQTSQLHVVLAACAIFGFSAGNLMTLPPLIIQREFSRRSFGTVMGLSNAISGTVGSFGPAVVGFAHEASGDYRSALVICILLELAAAAMVVQRPRPAPGPA